MRRKRIQKRRLTVQSLETRKLFAADFGVSPSCSVEIECKVPAMVGPIRPAGIECKVPAGANIGGSVDPGGDDV